MFCRVWLAISCFSAWVSALLAGVLSFVWPKESSQRKGHPWVGAGVAGSLRYSERRAAAELGALPLKQSSPKAPAFLRCSAPLKGPGKASTIKQRISFFGFFSG